MKNLQRPRQVTAPAMNESGGQAGKGERKMVQRPKLNSTGRVTTSGWDPGGARREMADLKARSKGGKKKKRCKQSLCNQYRLKKDQMDENLEKKQVRDEC